MNIEQRQQPKVNLPKCLNFLRQLFIISVAIIFLLGCPFVLLFLCPVYIYRYLLGHTLQYVKPKFGKLLTARATIFAQDDLFTKPKLNLLIGATIEGQVEVETVREAIRGNLIENMLPGGELKYPELQQTIVPWGGFMFWKNVENFDLKKHVRTWDRPKCLNNNKNNTSGDNKTDIFGEEDIELVRQELIEKPWIKGQPVWEIVFINNFYLHGGQEVNTVMFLLCHHSLLDGVGSKCLLTEGLYGTEAYAKLREQVEGINAEEKSLPIWYSLALPFKCAYDAASLVIRVLQPTPWRPSVKEQSGKFHLTLGDTIPLQNIKTIKSFFKASFSSVVLSVIGGAMREMMLAKGVRPPKDMMCTVVLPLPRSNMKLRNVVTAAYLRIPTRESCAVKRLKLCSEEFSRLKRSTLGIQTHWAFVFMGCLFNCWCKVVSRNRYVPLVISNFIGESEYVYVCGHKIEGAFFGVGPQLGNVGLSFWVLSYVDRFCISHTAEGSLFSKDEAKQLSKEITKQIQHLVEISQV